MLQEMIESQERRFKLQMEWMRMIGDLQKQAEETRSVAIRNQASISRLGAFDEALHQLDNLRREADHDRLVIQHTHERVKLMLQWAKPLENGYGYSTQYPKRTWDGFQALLEYLPADERKKLRAIQLTDAETSDDNFVSPVERPMEEWGTPTLGQLLNWAMIPPFACPKQGTPLHNRFLDDVFPKIAEAVKKADDDYEKSKAAADDAKLKIVKDLLAAGQTGASA